LKSFLLALILVPVLVSAQDSSLKISVKYVDQVAEKAEKVSIKITQRSEKAIQKFQKQEEKIYRKLLKVDSMRAKK
jgi:hypothetical protein